MSMHKSPQIKASMFFPCKICSTPTQQTCSLCRKVFYCSSQHQQIDWHIKHKLQCQGKIMNNYYTSSQEQSISKDRQQFAYDTRQVESRNTQVRLENQVKYFMTLFQERLILRKKLTDDYTRLTNNSSEYAVNEVIADGQQLVQISGQVTVHFKASYSGILDQMYGITTSEFILVLDQVLDKTLLAFIHHKHQKASQIRKYLSLISSIIPQYPSAITSQLSNHHRNRQIYENVLKSIMRISQLYCNDRVTQDILRKVVKMVERFDGVYQRIYAYFNMGTWYAKKTYANKAIKSYQYSLELINNHKVKQHTENSALLKADLLYNLAISMYSIGNQSKAIQNMQQSYRLRVKAIGKNSIESSECLESLSRWSFALKSWQDCLQYAKQCYRVRKLNIHHKKQQQGIQKLLQQIYNQLRQKKLQQQQQLSTKPPLYYQSLLSQPSHSSQPIQQSFIKQLNSLTKQQTMIAFKLVITPEMAETYSSKQWEKLTDLLDYTDKIMDKQHIRNIVLESQFTMALNENQRDQFVRRNKVQ